MITPRLSCRHTHLFRGARLGCATGTTPSGRVELAFADGVIVPATLTAREGGGFALDVPAHSTGRGTGIVARSWLVADPDPGAAELRVLLRLT